MPRTFVLSGWGIKPSVLNAPKNYTFETYEYVKKHIQQQHCTVKLIGFSLGAQQALQISQMFPKKISSLHLISWRAFFKENELIIAKKNLIKNKNNYMKYFYKRCFNIREDWELFKLKHLEHHLNDFSLNTLLSQLDLFTTYKPIKPFKTISCPIQLIHSKSDKIAPFNELESYCHNYPITEHTLGHCPFINPSFKWP